MLMQYSKCRTNGRLLTSRTLVAERRIAAQQLISATNLHSLARIPPKAHTKLLGSGPRALNDLREHYRGGVAIAWVVHASYDAPVAEMIGYAQEVCHK